MARIVASSSHEVEPLHRGWQMAAPPAPLGDLAGLAAAEPRWVDTTVPGTAAATLRGAGPRVEGEALDLDARELWWRLRFAGQHGPPGGSVLRLGGLATLCDAWLNGAHLLRSESMFAEHALDVGARLEDSNELVLRFASLDEELRRRRPRPRWKSGFARSQQQRWIRTTLMGRTPTWPVPAPVGPWRPITLERRSPLAILSADLRATADGDDGLTRVDVRVRPVGDAPAPRAAVLRVGRAAADLACEPGPDGATALRGKVRVPAAERWWPATHGQPALYPVVVEIDGAVRVDLGRVGFRDIEVDRTAGGFSLRVNGVPVFCRGACWVPLDADALDAPPESYRAALRAMKDAGMNMVRLPGNFVYERDLFHDLCDELGLLVWQDLMFAALDYPDDDPAFLTTARDEAAQVVSSLQAHPSLAVLCGGSESLYQAALLGRPVEHSRLFEDELREACAHERPDVCYVPNSPGGGEPPFRVDAGVAHYFGVGAYRRPLEDARRSGVRFATEALAIANVPEQDLLDAWLEGVTPVAHPRWKQGVPRDAGAGWDFDDVRDHYLEQLFGGSAQALRTSDPERYLEVSRVVSGEVMQATLAELRSNGVCAGALVWTLKDLRAGAGWGLLDVRGAPKAAYWMLRRALQPIALLVTDEGLNGLRLHAVNDTAAELLGSAEVSLHRGAATVASGSTPVRVPARGRVSVPAHAALRRFADEAYAFRFGPPQHDVVVAVLRGADGRVLSEAVHFPAGRQRVLDCDPGLEVAAVAVGPGQAIVRLRARSLAYAAAVICEPPGRPEDSYLHVPPGAEREVHVWARPGALVEGEVRPLNGAAARFRVQLPEAGP